MPTVCHITSFAKFPIPNPIPSLTIVTAFPEHLDECTGKAFHAEMADLRQEMAVNPNLQHAIQEEEAKDKKFIQGQGFAFTYFPLPGTAYFKNGQLIGSMTLGAQGSLSKDCEQLRARVAENSRRLEEALQAANNTCPDVRKRLRLRAEDVSPKSLTELLGSFPELGAPRGSRGGVLDFNAGYYFQAGTGGVATGVFGGVAWTGRDLGKRYSGCDQWKKVIDLWYQSPSSEPTVAAASKLFECDLNI